MDKKEKERIERNENLNKFNSITQKVKPENQNQTHNVRKEVECGWTIFSVYNTETNNRVNYFATAEEAQTFAHRQESETARRKQNRNK